MEIKNETSRNPYALHHGLLERKVLAAATVDRSLLTDAGIEISEGWLQEAFEQRNDCLTYTDDFEFMRHLHSRGEFAKPLQDSLVTTMAHSDVFLSLALHENDLAKFLFSDGASAAGWSQDEQVYWGLQAAIAANKSYEYGLTLRAFRRRGLVTGRRQH